MNSRAVTLGQYINDLMMKHEHTNRSLAAVAGVSEGAIRNLLKFGVDGKAKDPDPRTITRVAMALDVDPIQLYRLAGYLPPAPDAHSPRADYLAQIFDALPEEKKDAVMGVLEAMAVTPSHREAIRQMRRDPGNALAGIEQQFYAAIRHMANIAIGKYDMIEPEQAEMIGADDIIGTARWGDLPTVVQERVKALIRRKLSLDYDPTFVDPEWRT